MLFKDVAGQEQVKHNLVKGVRNGHISHAQLFFGKEGYGALPMAIAYAQYLNCEAPSDNDSCGTCNSCYKYSKLIHPDLHFSFPVIGANELSAAFIEEFRAALAENPYITYNQWIQRIASENKQGNITAAECYEIIRKLSLKTFEGKFKILIMWLPEFLGKEGNILLKLIEEPTENTLMIFVAEDRDKILSTIQSRTQVIPFNALTENEITEGLEKRYGLESGRAVSLAKLSDGSFGMAVQLMDETENNFHDIFRGWMLACVKNQIGEIIPLIDEMSAMGRLQLKNLLGYGLYVFRAAMLHNTGVYDRIIANTSDKDFISKFSRFLNHKNIHGFAHEFNDAIFHIERNANPKITLLNLSLQVQKLFKM